MNGVNIVGIGKYVPDLVVTNDMLSEIVDTNDEWITTRTGIKSRHITNGEPTFCLGAKAAKAAIENAGVDPKNIGLIIATTITNDFTTPSVACLIQREIGAVGSMAIDINCACAGFVYAFDMAKRYLETDKNLKYVLVVSAEELSKITDYTDRSTCVLFGVMRTKFFQVISALTEQVLNICLQEAIIQKLRLPQITKDLTIKCPTATVVFCFKTVKKFINLPQKHCLWQLKNPVVKSV